MSRRQPESRFVSRRIRSLAMSLRDFAQRDGGAIAIFLALAIVPALLLIGLAVDASRAYAAQSRLAYAVDSAALAGGRAYVQVPKGTSVAMRKQTAEAAVRAYFAANYPKDYQDATQEALVVSISDTGTVLKVDVETAIPTTFMRLLGFNDMKVEGTASVGREVPKREIVLVLDNTFSMSFLTASGKTRFDYVRAAALNLANFLFDQSTTPGDIRIGIVPFVAAININSERPLADNPDMGLPLSSPPPLMGDRLRYLVDDRGRPYTQATLDAAFAPATWRGCIQAPLTEGLVAGLRRVDPVTDNVPAGGMVWRPHLYPSTFGSTETGPGSWNVTGRLNFKGQGTYARCKGVGDNDWVGASVTRGRPVKCWDEKGVLQTIGPTDYCISDVNEPGWNRRGVRQCPSFMEVPLLPPSGVPMEYVGTTVAGDIDMVGPNVNCPDAILGLSGHRMQVLRKIESLGLRSRGGTMNDIGALWALRVLSPRQEWRSFFGTADRNYPGPFQSVDGAGPTQKYVILLTDGDNMIGDVLGRLGETRIMESGSYWSIINGLPNGWGDYTYYGRPKNPAGGRSSPTDTRDLNVLMTAACDAMKKPPYNVTMFTLGVDIRSGTSAANVMAQCATTPSMAYNVESTGVADAFNAIASQIANLRLTQ